jgi:hypothetical protein
MTEIVSLCNSFISAVGFDPTIANLIPSILAVITGHTFLQNQITPSALGGWPKPPTNKIFFLLLKPAIGRAGVLKKYGRIVDTL